MLQVDQHDEEDEEEGLFLQQICHHKVTGERLTTIKLNNGKFYNMIMAVKRLITQRLSNLSCPLSSFIIMEVRRNLLLSLDVCVFYGTTKSATLLNDRVFTTKCIVLFYI